MRPSESTAIGKLTLKGSVKSGAVCGLVAAWAIFGLILAAGAQLALPPGTFYQMVGVSLGQHAEWPAIYLGFVLHMITGTIIWLRTDSTPKTFGTGVLTGIVVWAVLFIPLHSFLIEPTLQNMLSTSPVGSPLQLMAQRLVQMSDSILYGALVMHLIFGAVLGFMARIATSSRGRIENTTH
jgi:hypothetical protein